MKQSTIFDSAMGVDLGGTKLLIRYRDQWVRINTGVNFGASQLTEILCKFIDEQSQRPHALGIAVPGLVENNAVVSCDVLPKLVGWSAGAALKGQDIKCALINDTKAALHETTFDLPSGITAVTVMAGTAIGCGIMADGKLMRGARGWAGELGYWPVQSTSSTWVRLDEIAGGRYMAQRLAIDGKQLAWLNAQGDTHARAVVTEGGRALGSALAGLINLLNPHRLTVGGGALKLSGYWDAAYAQIQALSIPDMRLMCDVRNAHEVEDLVARGAARLALIKSP